MAVDGNTLTLKNTLLKVFYISHLIGISQQPVIQIKQGSLCPFIFVEKQLNSAILVTGPKAKPGFLTSEPVLFHLSSWIGHLSLTCMFNSLGIWLWQKICLRNSRLTLSQMPKNHKVTKSHCFLCSDSKLIIMGLKTDPPSSQRAVLMLVRSVVIYVIALFLHQVKLLV